MKQEQKETYTQFSIDRFEELENKTLDQTIEENDVIILLNKDINFSEELATRLGTLQEIAEAAEKAVVVVHSNVEMMDALDDYCICLPTQSEAHDYIYMEQLERNF